MICELNLKQNKAIEFTKESEPSRYFDMLISKYIFEINLVAAKINNNIGSISSILHQF